jgi:hypothetical protein
MRIFISYSNPNLNIIKSLAERLTIFGDVFFWNENDTPGVIAWEQIYNWIDYADIVIVLITDYNVVRTMAIDREIGRAKEKNKYIFPLVSSDVPRNELEYLSNTAYEPVDISNPFAAVEKNLRIMENRIDNKDLNKKRALVLESIAFLLLLTKES